MKVLLLTKDNYWTSLAENFLKLLFGESSVKAYRSNEKYKKIPSEVLEEEGDLLVSFLSPWIVPESLLRKFKIAINFHPGPPEYPGIGCYNFALYEDAKEYGVTCHFMSPEVDSGSIMNVIRFPIYPEDVPETLQERSMVYMLILFYDIISKIYRGEALVPSGEKWLRKPFTRKELNELCRIDPVNMCVEEIKCRIRATIHSNVKYGPFIEIGNYRFYLDSGNLKHLRKG